ncbi:formate dehydrogenase subunit gamma [Thalassococcus lentus]|uniref:Formate dehydrogenase subunit gamma n=1 Tax=Thalassococcus lentus TaxID=1210524 RepID=A0ABT4XXJ8_9RHOB|nr:formate dehydrogenase subunit gamma [Thalassococcus lentus]MDA7426676.1 formate dehydrogenase subunit gamma [Thalassococcus lentus]
MRALLCLIALCFAVSQPALAQDTTAEVDTGAAAVDRSATGGAQTLEDILRRQRGEEVAPRGDAEIDDGSAAAMVGQLAPLGGASDSEVWRALRYGYDGVEVSSGGSVGRVLMQDGGMWWYEFRAGPLSKYGGWLLLGTIGFLFVFFLLRGRIRIDGEKTGSTVTRFQFIERSAHWLLAGSFLLLGFTGLFVKYGRELIAPLIGKDMNATLLLASKFVHNNVAWAFMLALVMVFFMWVWHNIPNRHDLTWFAQAGGIVGSKHPPAKKFNAGQKIIFWSVILLGGSISVSGLSLLFPFELPLFAKTFVVLNDIGVPGWLGMAPFPVELSPQEEMQFAQLWHAIVSFVLMAIIIAHIYIGSVGMEGAFDAMGSGEVDEAWAHQHHSIWLEEVKAKEQAGPKDATPAE